MSDSFGGKQRPGVGPLSAVRKPQRFVWFSAGNSPARQPVVAFLATVLARQEVADDLLLVLTFSAMGVRDMFAGDIGEYGISNSLSRKRSKRISSGFHHAPISTFG
ncbi:MULTISPECIES: hypothetical protein [Mesorhizobium]|uniref:Uncharacterized protein n=1 Tax=Rhizobium loti TaxID=381 RepID=A0A1A5IGU5_RHILI|nr:MULTISPECIES: hypothetical protein [Mesorhizobium]ANN60712.1 hypothetical protein A9174_31065 [Mesorhizobium loti NZP2037]OBP78002.1 hypothetical protein BAE39_30665 [Mesorhizobium loti]OBP81278.1 hypothetical protein BAE41_06025 [Mesorhizobium loti]OBP88394.1 hypothetical protein BAE38_14385 [Mesorhizobium loti]OBQ69353.1 hypothetical protein A9K72_14485 [Mesorhizobium loti]